MDRQRQTHGLPLAPGERAGRDAVVLPALRTLLGEAAFGAVWGQGQSMSLEQAIAYALAEDE